MKIVSLTACGIDFYPQVGQSFLGGNSLNFAVQARTSAPEAKVAMVTALGTDDDGKRIRNFLLHQNISTDRVYVQTGKTTTNHIVNDRDGERYGVPDTWDGGITASYVLSPDDWEYVLDHDIIAVPANNVNFQSMLEMKQPKNIVAVDFLDVANRIPIEQYLHRTDIAFLAGQEGLIEHYQRLANQTGTLLVMTMGAQGSVAFFQGKIYRQKAVAVSKVIDTTGCGDSYQAAFTVTYNKKQNIPEAMNAGAEAASHILRHYGGVVEETGFSSGYAKA
jgi:fructoselysine 6-kinase